MAKIVVIGTGGIRAFRQVGLATELIELGHEVRCLNTRTSMIFLAVGFIKQPGKLLPFLKNWHSPLGEILCYFSEFFGSVSHIGTARWADVIVVAPATCNSIAKITTGITDNFPMLVIRAFARNRKVIIVPAMNPEMWADPATQYNAGRLTETQKYMLVGPVMGTTVSGDTGLGVMAPNDQIIAAINKSLSFSVKASA